MRYLEIAILSTLTFSSTVLAEEPKLLNLQNIESSVSEDTATITLSFSGPVTERVFDLKEQDGFFQVDLPHTLVPENSKFYDGKGSSIKKIAAYQVSPNSAVARIYVGPYDLSKGTKATLKTNTADNRAYVRLPLSIFKKETTPAVSTTAPTAPQAVAKSSSIVLGDHDLEFYIQRLGIFSLLFFATIFSFLSLRRLQKNKVFKASGEGTFKMKTLSQLVLSPRQKLCLIQIGNEQILIAVSPDQVTMMTRIGHQEPKSISAAETEAPVYRKKVPPYRKPDQFLENLKASMTNQETKTANNPPPQETIEEMLIPEKKSINYAISDDGITDKTKESKRAIDDITRLIREKLKALPQI